ncbi:serine hydroxymethyltransferase [Striga asiatica]|uniref:Serine hydroxymethyltransferase n=1 Tax=Striga asiatica TaxID=4170 RepID=A0A5A7QII3_STRAF|nr:serine hydroxymethyltransferase [Striga asiatica]
MDTSISWSETDEDKKLVSTFKTNKMNLSYTSRAQKDEICHPTHLRCDLNHGIKRSQASTARALSTLFSDAKPRYNWEDPLIICIIFLFSSSNCVTCSMSSTSFCCFLIRDLRADSRFDCFLFLFLSSSIFQGKKAGEFQRVAAGVKEYYGERVDNPNSEHQKSICHGNRRVVKYIFSQRRGGLGNSGGMKRICRLKKNRAKNANLSADRSITYQTSDQKSRDNKTGEKSGKKKNKMNYNKSNQ